MNILKILRNMHQSAILLFSFLAAILIGALLLMLPFSTQNNTISFIDALFTAASAVCVTGLIVVDTGSFFTIIGQVIILILIQIGGLGIMTLSILFYRNIKKSVSIKHEQIIQDLYSHSPRKDIWKLVKVIFIFTALSEGLGSLFLFFSLDSRFSCSTLFNALFHSVSAFCNAGFSLYPDSLESFGQNPSISLIISLLIILGGIGFPVIFNLFNKISSIGDRSVRLSVQTKTVLITTLLLIIIGTIFFYFIESDRILVNNTTSHKFLYSFFQAVTSRTAGFNTINISALSSPTLVLIIFLMFIGASPGSCGGGVKTTTVAVIFMNLLSKIRRKEQTTLFNRGIPKLVIEKSMTVLLISMTFIGFFTFLLLMLNNSNELIPEVVNGNPLPILFEVVSAFGTVGLSMGITSSFGIISKFLIIILMIIGRVGILSLVYIIIGNGSLDTKQYAEENLMIG